MHKSTQSDFFMNQKEQPLSLTVKPNIIVHRLSAVCVCGSQCGSQFKHGNYRQLPQCHQ